MKSLDPRVNRLASEGNWTDEIATSKMDQFETYQVFVLMRQGRPYQHVGIVHAPNEEMAFLFAKEQFSRRNTCLAMWVVKTANVRVTDYFDNNRNVYDTISSDGENKGNISFEIFHLLKRGKQHVHAGTVKAENFDAALGEAKLILDIKVPVLNIWVAKTEDLLFMDEEDRDIWLLLPEKKHRDIIAYKAGDKLAKFKESRQ